MLKIYINLHLILFSILMQAQHLDSYLKKSLILDGDTLNYRIHYPNKYNPKKTYPVITYLHGSGERGNDNELPISIGGMFFISGNPPVNAIIIFPQCPENKSWRHLIWNPDSTKRHEFDISYTDIPERPSVLLKALFDKLQKDKIADPSRMYIGGSSMGGFGTLDMIERYPDYFAAAFPICGGGDPAKASVFAKKVAVWIFHGGSDNVVYPDRSRVYYEKLKELKADVKYTEYPSVGHNSWDSVFQEQNLISWLMSNRKKP